MKSSVAVLAASAGLAQSKLALYPTMAQSDNICHAKPYKQFLPLIDYAPAASYCSSKFPVYTPVCGTTVSQGTVTTTASGTEHNLAPTSYTYEDFVTSTVTETVSTVTRCGPSPQQTSAQSTSAAAPQKRSVKKHASTTLHKKPAKKTSKKSVKHAATTTHHAKGRIAAADTTPAPSTSCTKNHPVLSSKLAIIKNWSQKPKAITACRCIQSNPHCTTRTVYSPAVISTIYIDGAKPQETSYATSYTTIDTTQSVTETVYDAECTGPRKFGDPV